MAEIRKFDPAAGNAIAQALREVMGEPVRPVPPGEQPPAPGPDTPEEPPTTWKSFTVTRHPGT